MNTVNANIPGPAKVEEPAKETERTVKREEEGQQGVPAKILQMGKLRL